MGLGKWNGKRHLPITPYKGSWAHEEELKRQFRLKYPLWYTMSTKERSELFKAFKANS